MVKRTKTAESSRQRKAKVEQPQTERSLLNPELLQRLYSNMLKYRMVEQRTPELFGRAGTGDRRRWEATEVGAVIDLQPEDAVVAARHNAVVPMVRGVPLKSIYTQLSTASTAPHGTALRQLHPSDWNLISAEAIAPQIATGMAAAFKMQDKVGVVVTLCGTGTGAAGKWCEVFAFAAAHKLPIVYVSEKSGAEQNGGVAPQLSAAEACGIPVITVDASDAIAVYRVCSEARELARKGYGPTVVACDPLSRTSKNAGLAHGDSIAALERYLHKINLWDNAWSQKITRQISREIQAMQRLQKAHKKQPKRRS